MLFDDSMLQYETSRQTVSTRNPSLFIEIFEQNVCEHFRKAHMQIRFELFLLLNLLGFCEHQICSMCKINRRHLYVWTLLHDPTATRLEVRINVCLCALSHSYPKRCTKACVETRVDPKSCTEKRFVNICGSSQINRKRLGLPLTRSDQTSHPHLWMDSSLIEDGVGWGLVGFDGRRWLGLQQMPYEW